MSKSPLYNLLQNFQDENILIAYRGEIKEDMLEAVYEMMSRVGDEKKPPADKQKKIFYILVEALQNVFRHQAKDAGVINGMPSGFMIRREDDNAYVVTTGNCLPSGAVDEIKVRINEINGYSAEQLREKSRQSLNTGRISEKGGAGLGLIEMARKSGQKLKFEFEKVDDNYSFFILEVTIR